MMKWWKTWAFLLLLCVGVLLPFLILFFIADLTTSAFFILAGYLTCFVHACSDSLQIIHTTKRCHCSTVKGQTGPILNIHLHIYLSRRKKQVPLLLSKLVLLETLKKSGKPSVSNLFKVHWEKQIKEYFWVFFLNINISLFSNSIKPFCLYVCIQRCKLIASKKENGGGCFIHDEIQYIKEWCYSTLM